MAFSSSLIKRLIVNARVMKIYSYTNTAGSTGGVVQSGLKTVKFARSSTEVTQADTTNKLELNTGSGGAEAGSVKITTVADEDGHMLIVGN